jgi:hypothetical protein
VPCNVNAEIQFDPGVPLIVHRADAQRPGGSVAAGAVDRGEDGAVGDFQLALVLLCVLGLGPYAIPGRDVKAVNLRILLCGNNLRTLWLT